ncbi:MAG: type I methionyl aminopeptidase [Chlorobiaceae bacterium]|nr:type I methionyl aminopeptidase [Chlorobiaceae bacterium]MBA4310132.1 type I methionyl aminopeptidase [Chlorobiaceae bacterium]
MILIKTKKEIDYIRESCKIVAETLNLLKSFIKSGITTKELDFIAEEYILSRNGKPAFRGYKQGNSPAYPATLCVSVNDEVVHGIPSKRELVEGDIVSIDVGVKKDGYFGDGAWTFPVGKISEENARLLEMTERSLYVGISQAIAGNKIHDISYAIQTFIESNGYSIVRELHGHGVGKKLHEDPAVPNFGTKGTGAKLKNGMTIAIEPMVNLGKKEVFTAFDGWSVVAKDGKPSAHFEHTILINDDKPEILTSK